MRSNKYHNMLYSPKIYRGARTDGINSPPAKMAYFCSIFSGASINAICWCAASFKKLNQKTNLHQKGMPSVCVCVRFSALETKQMNGNERKMEGKERKMDGNERKMNGNDRKINGNERKRKGKWREMKGK